MDAWVGRLRKQSGSRLLSITPPPRRERAVPAGLLGGTTEGGAKTSVEEIIIPHFHHFGGFRLEFFMST